MIRTLHVKILFFLSVFVAFAVAATAQTSIEEYYQNAAGKTGGELKTALHSIIRNHTELPYTTKDAGDQYNVWEALKITDEDPNNTDNVLLIYTGRSEAKTHQDDGSGDNDSWNREHIWAKSHGDFGTARGAGTDIHHLRACDRSVNTDRSNKFFDNGGTAHSEAAECKFDGDSWEPRDAVKGDIARMILYMAVCYEGENGDPDLEMTNDMTYSMDNYSAPFFGKLSTLLIWNTQDPVDETEKTRNEKVYTIQGNRNPFIDHSEWVNTIWVDTDSNSPLVSTYTPENEAGDVSLTENLTLTFNEEVQEGTGNIIIKRYSDDSEFETLNVVSNPKVNFINNKVIINPEAEFQAGIRYYVVFDNGVITDASSNSFDGIADKTIWNFTTYIDTDSPVFTDLSPANEASAVSLTANLIIKFNEDIQAGTGNVTIKKYNSNEIFETLSIPNDNLVFSNNQLTINPEAKFEEGVKYYVVIDNGAITDASSNTFDGFSDKTVWNFTATYTPPAITGFTPADDSENVPIGTDLEITFDKNVQAGNGSIRILTNGSETAIAASDASVTYNGTQVSIDLSNDLETGTEYYINIDNNAFVSTNGVAFAGINSVTDWSFTTENPTGIDDLHTDGIPSFYPNPAVNEIRLKNMNDVESMYISNLTGRNIMEIKSPDTRISISKLPKGMYFVTFISSDGNRITKKLMKR